jgi:hypothetical protein
MFSKAELLGAKMVTFFSASTALRRLVAFNAPQASVNLASIKAAETFVGIVRTLFMTCIVPPVKFRFWTLISCVS